MSPVELEETKVDGQAIRSLELTVLTQLRETLSANTAALNKVGDKVDSMHDRVMKIELAKFDARIEEAAEDLTADLRRTEGELSRRIEEVKTSTKDKADALALAVTTSDKEQRKQGTQIAVMGAFMAVIGTVGGAAVGVIMTKIFGG